MQRHDQQLSELISKYEGAWQAGYAAFPSIVHERGLRRGVEVGVAFGGHAGAILERGGVDKLFGVDRYRHQAGYDDPMNLTQPVFDRLAKRVTQRMAPFGNRFELIREDSAGASQRFEDESLDFVYLDADHSAKGVMSDLCHWAVKVRVGGIVAGHDYGHRDFPGVKDSVDRYFGRFGWQVHEAGNGVWWVERQALPISFFSPCYNCAQWIKGTARSLIDGNLAGDDEYLLVDDGSTDGTANMLEGLAEANPNVRIFTHAQNRGGGAARNTAVHNARHQLLVCLDADNRLPAGLADTFRRHLLCSDAEVVVPETIRFFKDDGAQGQHREPTESHRASYPVGRAGFADYLGRGGRSHAAASGGNLLFTRGAYDQAGGFPNEAGALDAWGFGLRLAGTDAAIDVVPGTFYWHRCGHDSYWTRHRREGTMGLAATELIKPFLHRVHEKDRRYILGPGRERWYFERGKKRFRTAPTTSETEPRLGLREGLVALTHRVRPSRLRSGERDTARLRLLLGLGRSGTSWTLEVLARCDGKVRALSEPLHHLRPPITISDSPDRVACNYAERLPARHALLRAYADLSADRLPTIHRPSGALLCNAEQPERVLIKEVHALLATPAILHATRAKAVVLTRDPLRVVDSIFNCQGYESPYLHHEFSACGDSHLLSRIGTPTQTMRRLSLWREIDGNRDAQQRRMIAAVWAAAIVQRLLQVTAEQSPGRVMAIAYEQAIGDPQAVFAQAAEHLGLQFGDAARGFCEQTQSRDESQDPYSIYRARASQPDWRVLTDAQRAILTAILEEAELEYDPPVSVDCPNDPLMRRSA